MLRRLLLILALLCAAPAWAQRLFLWEVRAPSASLWLFGSIHVCRADCYPLPGAVTEALARAESFALELDPTDSTVQRSILDQALYGDGRTLAQDLPPVLMDRLSDYLTARGIKLELLQRMRPWMASTTLALVAATQLGFEVDHGIDLWLLGRARELGKPVLELETAQEQVASMAELPLADQRELLDQSLQLIEQGRLRTLLDELLLAWRGGDAPRMAALMRESMGEGAAADRLADSLLDARNRRMAERLGAWLDSGRTVFAVVGAAHLAGPGSLPEQLAARGYRVRQVGAEP